MYYLPGTILYTSHDNPTYNGYDLFTAYYVLEIIPLNFYNNPAS